MSHVSLIAEVSIIEMTSGGDQEGELMRDLGGERYRRLGNGIEFGQERGRDPIRALRGKPVCLPEIGVGYYPGFYWGRSGLVWSPEWCHGCGLDN